MSFAVAPSFEVAPRAMSHDRNRIEIVHAGAAKSSVGRREAGRLDDMGLDCETGTEPQNRSGILRNVGFVESDTHGLDGTNAGGHLGAQSYYSGFRRAIRRVLGPAGHGFGMFRWHACTLSVRVPIKRAGLRRF